MILPHPKNKIEINLLEKLNRLTTRQREVFDLLISIGYNNRQLADKLSIQVGTAKYHMRCILKRLELKTRYEIISVYKTMFFRFPKEEEFGH